MRESKLLTVSALSVRFGTPEGEVTAVSQFSCGIAPGEVVAVVGESGSGKSVAAHAILRILPHSATVTGFVSFKGMNLYGLSEYEMNRVRGSEIAILFQSPDRSLNPLYRIGRQIREPLMAHSCRISSDTIEQLLLGAGCDDPDDIIRKYPCQCSGGMNQRALFSIVSGLNPQIFIADEPTKGLDRQKVQDIARSLEKIRSSERGIILITHDILLARSLSDRVIVMYAGEIVESGISSDVFFSPLHPYTQALLKSLPENGFIPIPGMSPALSCLPPGCYFAPRCKQAMAMCEKIHPDVSRVQNREVRCLKSF